MKSSKAGFILSVILGLCIFSAMAATEDTLAKIKHDGVIKWGADASGGAPFVFNDPKNPDKVVGFELEIMDKLAAHMGVKHEQVQASWETLIPNMLTRRCDMVINGIEINEERKKVVAFSEPYYVYEQQLTVRVEDKEKYKSLADLKGKKIGTLSGAEANNVLAAAGFGEELLMPLDDSFTPYKNLELKRVEAVLQESIIAAYYAGKNPRLCNIPKTFSPGRYAVTVRKEDATLLMEIDRVLKLMKENGELAAIYKNWEIWTDGQKDVGVRQSPVEQNK